MHPDRDVDLGRALPANEADLTRDLGLDTLFAAMARGDIFLSSVARTVVLSSLTDPAEIRYRQQILADCLAQPTAVRRIYQVAVAAIEAEKNAYRFGAGRHPSGVLHRAVEVLEVLLQSLKQLRRIADEQASTFRSPGLTAFFEMLAAELGDDYFAVVEGHLQQLRFHTGVLVSAELGTGCKGRDYVLRRPRKVKRSWVERISLTNRFSYTLTIPERDVAGARALAELRDRGINLVANALAQSTDHILSFFTLLRAELGFYICCLNLHAQLVDNGMPLCFPEPVSADQAALSCHGLYDVCLGLRLADRAVGNDVVADGKSLVMITGANQGGKSTFLRSVGLAQLMMQSGMCVGAESFRTNICTGVFTHYSREEDATMTCGKLEEELRRMSEIVDHLKPRSVLLFNESFAATNEREGSQIARDVIRALVNSDIKILFVTHLFDLAHGLYGECADAALFLRAERQAGGHRTFRLIEGEPLPTSYGQDLYERIFGRATGGPEPVENAGHAWVQQVRFPAGPA